VNGIHDMGGRHGMGAIPYEQNEPAFHEPWEGRVYALTSAMRAHRKWTLDIDRHTLETFPAADYFRLSYYERWLRRLEIHVTRYGVATPEEVASGKAAAGTAKTTPALTMAGAARFGVRNIPSPVDPAVKPLFRIGHRVKAKNMHPAGHTRLPLYARGKQGVIVRDHGVYRFPDTAAHNLGDQRQHVYSVRFTARELWGAQASSRDSVHLDLWDDYLERA
jgi:nitrile hydratase beta subunit